ncbi:MAG: O-antigen ligase family protein [Arenicellales bacterium]
MKQYTTGIEIYLLSAMFFFVPIGETVKSIFLGLFVLYWLYLVFIKKAIVLSMDGWDALIAVWVLLIVVSTAFSGIKDNEWRASVDILRLLVFLYMIKSIQFKKPDIDRILFSLTAGTVAACLFMFWFQVSSGWLRGLSLISVGSENTSAVYLSMVSIFLLAYLVTYYQTIHKIFRILIILSLIITTSALIMTGSRAGFGAYIIALLLIITIGYSRNRKLYFFLISLPLIFILIAFMFKLEVVYEFYEELTSGSFLEIRIELWKYALIAGMKYPLFGLGAGNYDAVTAEQIYQWAKELDLVSAWGISQEQYWHSHAHNIFLQSFVDRGITGVIILISILIAWFIASLKCYRLYTKSRKKRLYFIWFSNIGALVTIVLTGFVITGLHHENGIIVMFLFGTLLSFIKDEWREGSQFNKS